MKIKIYNYIKNHPKTNFSDIYNNFKSDNLEKQDIGNTIRELEKDNLILSYENNIYPLEGFTNIEGYAQWNLTGFCWLANTDISNDWGISFNNKLDLTSIYNKKSSGLGHYIKGKLVSIDGNEFVYVIESKPTKNLKIIACYSEKEQKWIIQNSSNMLSFNLNNETEQLADEEIGIFNYNYQKNEYVLEEKIGYMYQPKIETLIIKKLAEISENTVNDNFNHEEKINLTLNKKFYTIDSIHTKDLDDAIWIEEVEHGFDLFIAIADVSSYVEKNSIIDINAKNVATTFYLPHETIHMLNRELAEKYCSLNPGEIKKSVVCHISLNMQGEVLKFNFSEENIIPNARLTYNDVDRILKQEQPTESLIFNNVLEKYIKNIDIENSLFTLKKLTDIVYKNEQNKDYWFVDSFDYALNEHGKIDYLYIEDRESPAQKMVETAMLFANKSAAQFVYKYYPKIGLFRNQTQKIAHESPLPAQYQANNHGHWGLQTDYYTHFTSPIRRYCDLTIHRLIKSILKNENKNYTESELESIGQHLNQQQYKAKQLDIKAKNLLLPQYISNLIDNETLSSTFQIIDFSDNGISFRNKQFIEIFVPNFKLDKAVTRETYFFGKKEFPIEIQHTEKKNLINKLNKRFNFNITINDYSMLTAKKLVEVKTIDHKPSIARKF